jgi:hypothetical protein
MNFKYYLSLIILFSLLIAIFGCNSDRSTFSVKESSALTNYQPESENKYLLLDYGNAADSGFIIPSINQTNSSYFHFNFNISNLKSGAGKYFYKIFYQNESYKFDEFNITDASYNNLSSENFYGSWDNYSENLKSIILKENETVSVVDSFRIVGNPRNEKKYYGKNQQNEITLNEISSLINYIKEDKAWYESIKEKAKTEKRTLEEQLRLDAIYSITDKKNKEVINIRGRRNPRVGQYQFYLILFDEMMVDSIPKYVTNIEERSGENYMNPFFYLKSKKQPNHGIEIIHFKEILNVKAQPDPGAGIYIDKTEFFNEKVSSEYFNNSCNNSEYLRRTAAFKQFVHRLPDQLKSPNIPLVADLQSIQLSVSDYNTFLKKYTANNMLPSTNVTTQCACETVKSDSLLKKIVMKNPGVRRNLKVKENVGVMSRHGFTYGTYTFKVKMPELLNKNNLWNGLTNALWLINEKSEDWNNLRPCNGKGYIPKYSPGIESSTRQNTIPYSEIDFEIRKAAPYWPLTSYAKDFPRPEYKEDYNDNIIVTCTNWDLACDQPPLFNSGARLFKHNNVEHIIHRWTHWYQALTSKYPANDDELFAGSHYYFQIEWKPESITWRMGPTKNNLREVGYMNNEVSSIPNNQMLFVFTQEYHISEWWPESPFLQEFIPLPEKDIYGEILGVEIE